MPEFERLSRGIETELSLSAEIGALRKTAPIFVDVSQRPTKAEVSRGGFSVGEINVLPAVLEGVLANRPIVATKVVSQSIVAGTAVARGTAIDVVLTRTDDLPIAVIPGIHQAFASQTVGAVFARFQTDATVKDIIRRRTEPGELTADEQTRLTAVLNTNGVEIGTDATNNLTSAFTALQAAFTFQG
jgi:uncharacterized protein (DUF2384 family)